MRTRTFCLSALCLAVLGVVIGYFLYEYVPKTGPTPPSLDEPPAAASQEPINGWCCPAPTQKCSPEVNPQRCIGNGGLLFNQDRTACDALCGVLKPTGS